MHFLPSKNIRRLYIDYFYFLCNIIILLNWWPFKVAGTFILLNNVDAIKTFNSHIRIATPFLGRVQKKEEKRLNSWFRCRPTHQSPLMQKRWKQSTCPETNFCMICVIRQFPNIALPKGQCRLWRVIITFSQKTLLALVFFWCLFMYMIQGGKKSYFLVLPT